MDTIRFASRSVMAALKSHRNKKTQQQQNPNPKRQHKLVVDTLLFLLLLKHACFYLISKDGKYFTGKKSCDTNGAEFIHIFTPDQAISIL